MKKIFLIILSIFVLFTAATLCACGKEGNDSTGTDSSAPGNTDSTNTEKEVYTVTVSDNDGNPISDIVVKIMLNGQMKTMKPTGKDGKAVFNLVPEDYTVELSITGNESYLYDESLLVIPKDKRELSIVFSKGFEGSETLYNDSVANYVSVGSYETNFGSEGLTYFLFTPKIAGRYKFSVESSVKTSVGYYGSPLMIYDFNIADEQDVVDGALFVDVRTYNIGDTLESTTRYLVGVKGEASGKGILKVERVSDLAMSPEEHPWTDYAKTKEIVPFTFAGGTLKDIDVLDATVSVVLSSDGYYHYESEDGPLVYLRLTSPSKYIASFEEMSKTQFFGRYVYGDDGEFLYKISYHTMILEYVAAAKAGGDAGIYPLTEDLAVMLKDMGAHLGWYTPATSGNENALFGTAPITENAWLFACVYVEEN